MAIQSDFFKNLIADILRFFRTGEVLFNKEETLEVMKMREAIIKANGRDGEWTEI